MIATAERAAANPSSSIQVVEPAPTPTGLRALFRGLCGVEATLAAPSPVQSPAGPPPPPRVGLHEPCHSDRAGAVACYDPDTDRWIDPATSTDSSGELWHRFLGGSWGGGVSEWQITSRGAGAWTGDRPPDSSRLGDKDSITASSLPEDPRLSVLSGQRPLRRAPPASAAVPEQPHQPDHHQPQRGRFRHRLYRRQTPEKIFVHATLKRGQVMDDFPKGFIRVHQHIRPKGLGEVIHVGREHKRCAGRELRRYPVIPGKALGTEPEQAVPARRGRQAGRRGEANQLVPRHVAHEQIVDGRGPLIRAVGLQEGGEPEDVPQRVHGEGHEIKRVAGGLARGPQVEGLLRAESDHAVEARQHVPADKVFRQGPRQRDVTRVEVKGVRERDKVRQGAEADAHGDRLAGKGTDEETTPAGRRKGEGLQPLGAQDGVIEAHARGIEHLERDLHGSSVAAGDAEYGYPEGQGYPNDQAQADGGNTVPQGLLAARCARVCEKPEKGHLSPPLSRVHA